MSGAPATPLTEAPLVDHGVAEKVIDRLLTLHPRGYDLSLDRIANLLSMLGNPHLRLPPTIHVAGTNGKGSVIAFARAILEAEGMAVHAHTSPHLVRWHERYRIGVPGAPARLVGDGELAEMLERVERANAGRPITVFELLTAAAFALFAEHPADAAVIEVGLGGRFDATNVIRRPAVAAIASIGLDHQQWLGETRPEIAREKAGIMKRGAPVVIGQQRHEDAREALLAEAERREVEALVYGQDFLAFEEHGRMVYQDGDGLLDLPLPALPGRHQIANAALAIASLKRGGFPLSERSIAQGLLDVSWPGRLQRVSRGPLRDIAPAGAELWLDGGHNPAAARVVAEALAQMEEERPRPLYLVTGMLTTKDPKPWFEAFKGLASQAFTVPVGSSEAGFEPAALAGHAIDSGIVARPVSGIREALERIARCAGEPAPRILVGGSLYVVGEALAMNGTPPE